MAQQSSTALKNSSKAISKHLIKKKLKLIGMKYKLIIAGILLAIILMGVIIAGLVAVIGGGSDDDRPIGIGIGQAMVSAEVLQYRDAVFAELSKYGLSEYTDLLLALMMQESGGRGNDPMQASESYCGSIGCITDPQLSIEKGVLHFKNVLEKANYDVKLTLQSYNFGGGFIDYVMKNGGSYTYELAISFSQMQYQKYAHLGIYKCHRPEAIQHNACYGDIGYVDAVLKYLASAGGAGGESVAVGSGEYHSPLSIGMRVTSPFGWRNIGAGPEFHQGIDLSCKQTDSIHAVKDGSIVYAGVMSSYGNLVTIQHGPSDYTSYAHLSRIDVTKGQQVSGGNQIGMCGTTGRSTGTHLHFEIKSQMWAGHVDPAPYLGLGGK